MPEGDTIHGVAVRLRAALLGKELTSVELPRIAGATPPAGSTVEAVEARGKHLLIWLSTGQVIHSHLRMTGVWRIYRRGERRRHSPSSVRIRLRTAEVDAVCTHAPVVEVLDRAAVRHHPALRRLGPDLTGPEPDLDEALDRLDDPVHAHRTIGEAMLDQRIASGIGNVYRSEVCFLHGLDPRTHVADVSRSEREALLRTASELLQANVNRIRTTVEASPPGTKWVYHRTGQPCRRCGTPISSEEVGEPPRRAYWCPTCQQARHQ